MKIRKFDQINEEIDIPSNLTIHIEFGEDIQLDINDIIYTDKFQEWLNDRRSEDGSGLDEAVQDAIEQYLYTNGDLDYTYKICNENGEEIDINMYSDAKNFNI